MHSASQTSKYETWKIFTVTKTLVQTRERDAALLKSHILHPLGDTREKLCAINLPGYALILRAFHGCWILFSFSTYKNMTKSV